MSRPRPRYAALGPFDGGEAILGLGVTPAAAIEEARAWQPHLGVVAPLWVLPLTDPLVVALLDADDEIVRQPPKIDRHPRKTVDH